MSDPNMAMNITSADVVFVMSGLVGMVSHYAKKWVKDETTSTLAGWFGKDNIKGTIMSFGAFGAAVLGALGAGIITPEMNVYAVIYAGLTTGWAVDSGFNSGHKD